MKLREILSGIDFRCANFQDVDIRGITINSNQVLKGYMFIALKGEERDGHDFIYQAIEKGAVALVVNEEFDQLMFHKNIVIIRVSDTREAVHK
ncbi:MAG TPA: hypothetical protein ENF97_00645, partial [Candidatus Omnitrophica bacterium]|nr:hypothetical protein [Candidatus Omnitrophota bacterium]